MTIFPTQYSTLSASALCDRIAENYGFNDLRCQFLLHGVSDTYKLESPNAPYIFKVYRNAHRSLNEIKGEVALLNQLQKQGAKVAYPVRDVWGEQIQAFNAAEGVRHGVLFTFAPGHNVYDLTDEQLQIVGQEMAFNHNITAHLDLPYERKTYDMDTTLTYPLTLIKPAFADDPEGYAYLLMLADQVRKKMAAFNTKDFGYGYCHYDYLPKNFHFDGNAFTLFDFDFAGKGYLANDLASFLVHFFFHTITGKITKEEGDRQFAVFIAGYREVRALSDEEIRAVPFLGILFWIFYLGFAYENFDDWSNSFFGPRFLKERVSIIRRFTEMYCQF